MPVEVNNCNCPVCYTAFIVLYLWRVSRAEIHGLPQARLRIAISLCMPRQTLWAWTPWGHGVRVLRRKSEDGCHPRASRQKRC